MARVAFPLVLQSPATGSAIVGATATITKHIVGQSLGSGPAASIYAVESAGSPIVGNQIATDDMGRWTQGRASGYAQYWLPQGTYDVVISGTGLTAYTITRELFSASQSDAVALAGELKFWPGVAVPGAFARADGSAYSRTSYPLLFAALCLPSTGNISGATISSVPSGDLATLTLVTGGLTSGLAIPISGPGITLGTTISAFNQGAQTITLSQAASTATGVALVIAPHGVGDGSTTFNVPDMRQRLPLGQAASGVGRVLGGIGGTINHAHSIPGLSIPGLSIPGLSIPGLSIPGLSIPGLSIPSLGVSVSVPNLSLFATVSPSVALYAGGLSGSAAAYPGGGSWSVGGVALGATANGSTGANTTGGGTTGGATTGGGTTGGATTGGGTTGGATSGTADPPFLACPWIIRHGVQ